MNKPTPEQIKVFLEAFTRLIVFEGLQRQNGRAKAFSDDEFKDLGERVEVVVSWLEELSE